MIKLGVALPAYGLSLDVGHASMWLGLGAALATAQDHFKLHWMTEYHINGVDLCRNTAVYDAIRAECDWLFMIDADTFHRSGEPGGVADAIGDAGIDILQMIRDGDRQLIAALGPNNEPALFPILQNGGYNGIGLIGAPVRRRGDGQGVNVINRLDVTVPLETLRGLVQPVDRIGAACIAINLKWLREHWFLPPWFVMEHDYSGRPRYAKSEDYNFCDGIRMRGGAVVCDGRFVPEHVAARRLVR